MKLGPLSNVPREHPAYVYRCEHKRTKKFYIGYREANEVAPEDDLGKWYFTSSTIISKNFEQYNYEILGKYDTGKTAFDVEQRLIFEFKDDPYCLNRWCKAEHKLIPVDADIVSIELEKLKQREVTTDNKRTNAIKAGLRMLNQIENSSENKVKHQLALRNKKIIKIAREFLKDNNITPDNENYTAIMRRSMVVDDRFIISINII